MASSVAIQLNPAPLARIITREPCTECEDEPKASGEPGAQDRVSLSPQAQNAGAAEEGEAGGEEEASGAPAGPADPTGRSLTQEELRQVQQLRARDREVRAHEQAHKAAAGPYAKGSPSFEYTTGPDGKRYAVGGEVQIDTSPVAGDPEATVRKAQTLRRAALAPAEPSPQDRRVAAQAAAMETRARQELQRERTAEARDGRQEAAPENSDTASQETGSPSSAESGATTPGLSSTRTRNRIANFEVPSAPSPGSRINLFS